MKNLIKYSLLVVVVMVFSCRDESLDPLNMKAVKKGTLLALRGTMLQRIYNQGKPGAELFPKIATGAEPFAFEAEYLSSDHASLASFDLYVIRKVTASTTSRELLMNVPFSQFVKDSKYLGPYVNIATTSAAVLAKVGVTFPLDAAEINTLLTTYAFGVQMEIDLNLVDGTKVLAADLVAAGLYQSNQFYPAQKLNYAMTDYCSYVANSWATTFNATETSEFFGGYGPYPVTFVQDGTNPNKFTTDNWYDSGITMYMILTPSVDPPSQIVTVPSQPNPSNTARTIVGSGTYNQCLGSMTINFTYSQGTNVLDKFLWKLTKP
jgi:hypothetical protein